MGAVFGDVKTSKLLIQNINGVGNVGELEEALRNGFPDVAGDDRFGLRVSFFRQNQTAVINATNGPPFNLSAIWRQLSEGPIGGNIWSFQADAGFERGQDGALVNNAPDVLVRSHLLPYEAPSRAFDEVILNESTPVLDKLRQLRHSQTYLLVCKNDQPDKPPVNADLIADVCRPLRLDLMAGGDGGEEEEGEQVYAVRFKSVMEATQAYLSLHGNPDRLHRTVFFRDTDGTIWPAIEGEFHGLGRDPENSNLNLDEGVHFYRIEDLRTDIFSTEMQIPVTNCNRCNNPFRFYGIHEDRLMIWATCGCETRHTPPRLRKTMLAKRTGMRDLYEVIEPLSCEYRDATIFRTDMKKAIDLEKCQKRAATRDGLLLGVEGIINVVHEAAFCVLVEKDFIAARDPASFTRIFGRTWDLRLNTDKPIEVEYKCLLKANHPLARHPIDNDPNHFVNLMFKGKVAPGSKGMSCQLVPRYSEEFYELTDRIMNSLILRPNPWELKHLKALVLGHDDSYIRQRTDPAYYINVLSHRIRSLCPRANEIFGRIGAAMKHAITESIYHRVYFFEERQDADSSMLANTLALLLVTGLEEKTVMVCSDWRRLERQLRQIINYAGDNVGIVNPVKHQSWTNPFIHQLGRHENDEFADFDLRAKVSHPNQRHHWLRIVGPEATRLMDRYREEGCHLRFSEDDYNAFIAAENKMMRRYLDEELKLLLVTPTDLVTLMRSCDGDLLYGASVILCDASRMGTIFAMGAMLGDLKRLTIFGGVHGPRQVVECHGARAAGLGKSVLDMLHIRGHRLVKCNVENVRLDNGLLD